MRKIFICGLFALICFIKLNAQVYPQTSAVRTNLPVKIDGILNDEGWKLAPLITGLTEQRPTPGKPENVLNKSELYLLYDNQAVYFGGNLYENSKDSISQQLGGRDIVGVNDFIGVVFDTYQDKSNGLGFYVSPLNEQFDVKYAIGGHNSEDISWNAVYTSAVTINDKGWSFEMRIPYSALRFSKNNVQDWGIQIIRRRAKSGQQYAWSPIDPNQFGFMNQAGTWKGLTNIQPPLRLSFSPYFSTYLTHNPKISSSWKPSVNGGMDVKYGISESFTMDMTLIPDFGQVQSDNQVLNLSPFEIRFNENRPFFSEGFELFNRGNLFYSRRIGGQPIHYYDVYRLIGPNHSVLKNPLESKLINATKISGRTNKKLGLGFFNALTKPQYAVIDDGTGKEYKLETSPKTNYNVMVIDQGLKNNSRITLINTNVLRDGSDYDANVTSISWDLYNKQVKWNFRGQVNYSSLNDYEKPGKTTKGYLYNLSIGRAKGRFTWDLHRFTVDNKYNQSDMGFFTNNNYITHGFNSNYKWTKPKSFYNNIFLNINGNYAQLNIPRKYQDFRLNGNINGQLKNLWQASINAEIKPLSNDFYEARLSGWTFRRPGSWLKGASFTTNRAKKYSAFFQLLHRNSGKYKTNNYELSLSNSYRFSNKFSAEVSHFMFFAKNDYGFAYSNGVDSVVTGLRKRHTAENILSIKYNFNNKMGLTFRLRHYWSKVEYTRFFNLSKDGYATNRLTPATRNPNINLNLFNIDMNYTWQIAPGSFINVNWKTSSDLANKLVMDRYFDNLGKTLDIPSFNSLSVKIIYYLDYLDLKGKK